MSQVLSVAVSEQHKHWLDDMKQKGAKQSPTMLLRMKIQEMIDAQAGLTATKQQLMEAIDERNSKIQELSEKIKAVWKAANEIADKAGINSTSVYEAYEKFSKASNIEVSSV